MCYDIKSTLEAHLRRAELLDDKEAYQEALERLWSYLSDVEREQYHVSGFSHPNVIIQFGENPNQMMVAQWGLIPHWSRDRQSAEKFWMNTLNARGETIFEKPSFRDSAKSKRCVVIVDGFYEHHHANGITYPFHVTKEKGYLILAGLWSEWLDKETGELRNTFTIVTTKGKKKMAAIHNSPKLPEPRTPVVLKEEDISTWLKGSKSELENLMASVDEDELLAFTVQRLRGKSYLGNCPEVCERFEFEELDLILD